MTERERQRQRERELERQRDKETDVESESKRQKERRRVRERKRDQEREKESKREKEIKSARERERARVIVGNPSNLCVHFIKRVHSSTEIHGNTFRSNVSQGSADSMSLSHNCNFRQLLVNYIPPEGSMLTLW